MRQRQRECWDRCATKARQRTYWRPDLFRGPQKRALKADAKRALSNQSLFDLMQMPVVEPIGRPLADRLKALGGAATTGAIAFAGPNSAYWTLVSECDGQSLWPMAVAGVSMLGGQSANKVACPDEGPLLGAGLPDVEFSSAMPERELCALARQRQFSTIVLIKSLQVTSAIDCGAVVSEQEQQ
jgi:hypothetical protein